MLTGPHFAYRVWVCTRHPLTGGVGPLCTRPAPVSVAFDDRQGGPAGGCGCLGGERRGSAAEGRAERLVVAPPAQPAGAGPEVAGGHRPLDRRPDGLEGALEADQLALVGGVGQRVAV